MVLITYLRSYFVTVNHTIKLYVLNIVHANRVLINNEMTEDRQKYFIKLIVN